MSGLADGGMGFVGGGGGGGGMGSAGGNMLQPLPQAGNGMGGAAAGGPGVAGAGMGLNGAGGGGGCMGSGSGAGSNQDTSSNGQSEYTLAGILHYLQSEWRRYERDRNEWEIERAEMRARIALLEGERRGIENLKTDLMRRVKMLEYALRQERSKYFSSSGNAPSAAAAAAAAAKHALGERSASGSGRTSPSRSDAEADVGAAHVKAGSTLSLTPSILGTLNGTGPGSDAGSTKGGTSSLSRQLTNSAKDPRSRAKSRYYLKQCLQEINYLTSVSVLNPLPDRGIESMVGAQYGSTPGPPRPRRTVGDNYNSPLLGHPSEGAAASLPSPSSYKRSPLGQGSFNALHQQPDAELGRARSLTSKAPYNQEPLMEANEPNAGEELSQPAEIVPSSNPSGVAAGAVGQGHPTIEIGKPSSPPSFTTDAPYDAPPKSPAMGTTPLPNGGSVEPYVTDRDSDSSATSRSWGSFSSGEESEGGFPDASSAPSVSVAGATTAVSPSTTSTSVPPADNDDEDHEAEQVTAIFRPGAGGAADGDWKKLKEEAQKQRERREHERRAGKAGAGSAAAAAGVNAQMTLTSDKTEQAKVAAAGRFSNDDELANLTLHDTDDEAAAEAKAANESSDVQLWKSKRILRSHLDAVRSIAFDGSNLALVSASDDNTLKYWSIDPTTTQPSLKLFADADSIITYRGHSAAVTSAIVSTQQRRAYSSSLDATIRVWRLPRHDSVPYLPFDPNTEEATLVGHTQAIWELCLLPDRSQNEVLLASASADGTVKLWDTQNLSSALKLSWDYFGSEPDTVAEKERRKFQAQGKELPVPTSISPCPANLRVCAVAYSNSVVKLFDIESGQQVLQMHSDATYDGTPATQINKVVAHPTLPLLITAHEDRYIRTFDLDTGTCTLSMQGHQDAVTSLDIDPAGLTLVSGGHDCSVRFWDLVSGPAAQAAAEGSNSGSKVMNKDKEAAAAGNNDATATGANGNVGGAAVCVQEISAHRKKAGEGVVAVKYHPSAPFFASAGADGIIRIYG
ncbi:WD40 repeat-like protein [Tilletiaria anomala UBC 951]|uniref:WD40 repeat-like protein n=1 Tax=Tilletiaria anomala (strain ATCC 24038 / CBS 436.72 / UBC 951) TaxID=1037660 RepID=A0A066VAD2_TILAU|nr:WD40 repeat-like protein [Tilletiaria anomala UBC 951]KDN38707.1 WD40 repeat-like protein [Tilletiaria anomala UBC 951]